MAIAFDTSQQEKNVTGGGAGPSTTSYTVTGSNTILFRTIRVDSNATVTACSYNGVAGTLLDSAVAIDNATVTSYLYMWVGPAAGAHNFSLTVSGAANVEATEASYTGANQSGQPDAKTTGGTTATGDPATISLTTVADNCWIVGSAVNLAESPITANTNATIRQTVTGANNVLFDTNGAQTPAGVKSMLFNNSGGFTIQALMASFAPAGGGGGGRGLFQASPLSGLGSAGSGYFRDPLSMRSL